MSTLSILYFDDLPFALDCGHVVCIGSASPWNGSKAPHIARLGYYYGPFEVTLHGYMLAEGMVGSATILMSWNGIGMERVIEERCVGLFYFILFNLSMYM